MNNAGVRGTNLEAGQKSAYNYSQPCTYAGSHREFILQQHGSNVLVHWKMRAVQTRVVQRSRHLCVSLKFHLKPYSVLNLKNVRCTPISRESSPHRCPALHISPSLLGWHNPNTMNFPKWKHPTLSTSVPFSKRSQHYRSQPENRNVSKVRSDDLCEIIKNLALDQLLSK